MKPYLCQSVELVNEPEKNPYLRLTFVDEETAKNDDPFIAILGRKKVTIVVSGGFFTNGQPDKTKNLQWCQVVQPKFQGQIAQLEEFECEVEPYYTLNAKGEPNSSLLNKMTITTFCVTNVEGKIEPLFGWNNLNRQAASRLKNGTTMYKTKAQVDAEQMVAAQAAQVNNVQMQPQAQPQAVPQANPFANVGANNFSDVPF